MLNRIMKGQNVTTGPEKFAMARRLLDGQALSTFEQTIMKESLTESGTNLEIALDSITTDIFPHRALEMQCCALGRYVRKPVDMTIMHLVARLTELNEQLPHYPNSDDSKKLGEDVIKEIVEFAIPREWTRQMQLQRFRVETKSLREVVELCKDMEQYEKANPIEIPKKKSNHKKRGSTKHKLDSTQNSSSDKTDLYCMLHGKGTHTTEKCKILQAMAKKHKANNEFRSTKNSSSNKKFTNQQVQMIVRSEIKKSKARDKKKVRKLIDQQVENFSHFTLDSDSDTANQILSTENNDSQSVTTFDISNLEDKESNDDDSKSSTSDSTEENKFA